MGGWMGIISYREINFLPIETLASRGVRRRLNEDELVNKLLWEGIYERFYYFALIRFAY